MDVVWLTSYPKSGNTWVRFLLTNLIHGPFEDSRTIFEVTPVLERGIDPASLVEDRVNLIKTHRLFSPGIDYMEHAVGAIYVVRDPFDVMLSNLNYYFVETGAAIGKDSAEIRRIMNGYVVDYLRRGGFEGWSRAGFGAWAEHARSWVHNESSLPVKLVRYEDLQTDTVSALRDICGFLALDATDARLEQAVERSSFQRMREIEEREIRDRIPGMFYLPARARKLGDTGFRFMNRGRAGVSRHELADELRERHAGAFAPMIGELGYA
jgi:hypothetical protein